MEAKELLAQFTILTPCSKDWDWMTGDDRKPLLRRLRQARL